MKTRRPCPRRSSCPASISRCRPDSASACWHQRRRQVDLHQDHRRRAAIAGGDTQFNKGLSIGYFAQHQVEMLRHDESPLWHMTKLAPNVREQELRNFLGSFNFNGAMATSPITPFSGGEGAAGAGADRLAAPQPAAGRTHQPPGPGNARSADQRAGAVRGHAGAGLARPPPAARQHRPVHHRGRRPVRPFDGDLDDSGWLYQTKLSAKAA